LVDGIDLLAGVALAGRTGLCAGIIKIAVRQRHQLLPGGLMHIAQRQRSPSGLSSCGQDLDSESGAILGHGHRIQYRSVNVGGRDAIKTRRRHLRRGLPEFIGQKSQPLLGLRVT